MTIVAAIISGLFCAQYLRIIWRQRLVQDLARAHPPEPSTWPSLTMVVPACNEAETIEEAMRSLRAIDYPNLRIIVVNDRSTDETGALLDACAAEDPRITAIHNDALPDGWLGKVHALHLGAQRTDSDWLLFSDADVHLAPGALRKAVAYAEAQGLDHLPLCPDLSSRSLWTNTAIATFHLQMLILVNPSHVYDPERPEAVGIGAFNLVRGEVFRRSEGFEWLRLDVADDFALGMMLKRAGARSELVYGHELVRVEWYPSVPSMIGGFEKNAYGALGHYSVGHSIRQLGSGAVAMTLMLWPLATQGPTPTTLAIAVAPLLALWAAGLVMAQRVGWPAHRFLLVPVGLPLLMYGVLNGLWRGWRDGGISWRGTFYSAEALRAGQRVKL